jgi:hypothetical protein
MHANKVTTIISSWLIQQNTYKQYISAKQEVLEAIIENSDEFIVFFTHICKHLQNADSSIPHTNIKQISDTLSKVIFNVVKYNLAQVLPQFRRVHKSSCKIYHSADHFDNQCLNRALYQ